MKFKFQIERFPAILSIAFGLVSFIYVLWWFWWPTEAGVARPLNGFMLSLEGHSRTTGFGWIGIFIYTVVHSVTGGILGWIIFCILRAIKSIWKKIKIEPPGSANPPSAGD